MNKSTVSIYTPKNELIKTIELKEAKAIEMLCSILLKREHGEGRHNRLQIGTYDQEGNETIKARQLIFANGVLTRVYKYNFVGDFVNNLLIK